MSQSATTQQNIDRDVEATLHVALNEFDPLISAMATAAAMDAATANPFNPNAHSDQIKSHAAAIASLQRDIKSVNDRRDGLLSFLFSEENNMRANFEAAMKRMSDLRENCERSRLSEVHGIRIQMQAHQAAMSVLQPEAEASAKFAAAGSKKVNIETPPARPAAPAGVAVASQPPAPVPVPAASA